MTDFRIKTLESDNADQAAPAKTPVSALASTHDKATGGVAPPIVPALPVQCDCGRIDPPDMMTRIDTLPLATRQASGWPDTVVYKCSGCRTDAHRRGTLKMEDLVRSHGGPADALARAKAHDDAHDSTHGKGHP